MAGSSGNGVLCVSERWIREHLGLQKDCLDDVRSVSLPGSYHNKITHLGLSLISFVRLKHLDLSRNALESLAGLDHLKNLETLNIYYNNVPTLDELFRLRYNKKLKDLDVRLNPVTKSEPDYRLFLVHMLVNLRTLDDRSVRDSERKAALLHFNSEQAHMFDKSNDSSTPKTSRSSPHQGSHKHLSARKELVSSLAPRPNFLDDDTDELLDLISKRDRFRTGQSSQVKVQKSSTKLSTPTRRRSTTHHKTTEDHNDTAVKGQFTPAPNLASPDFKNNKAEFDLKDGINDRVNTALGDLLEFMQWFVEGDLGPLQQNSEFKDKFLNWFHAHTPSTPPPPTNTHLHTSHSAQRDDGLVHQHQEELKALQQNLEAQLGVYESQIQFLTQQWEEAQHNSEQMSHYATKNEELEQLLQQANRDSSSLQEHVHTLQQENISLRAALDKAPPTSHTDSLKEHISELESERESLRMELNNAMERQQHDIETSTQLQQLIVMLQESHSSLVSTNSHLLQELEETKERHSQEVTQMNTNYENLRKTIDTQNIIDLT